MRAAFTLTLFLAAPVLAAPTYDLRPLAEVSDEYARIAATSTTSRSRKKPAFIARLAAASTVTEVKQAAWYLQHRGCLDDRRKGCASLPEVNPDNEPVIAPFRQRLLHMRARRAIASKRYEKAWAILSAADSALKETNRLLLSLAERTVSGPWADGFAQRLERMQAHLSRRQRCRLLLVMGDKADEVTRKWSAYRQVWLGRCGPLRRDALERLVTIGMTPSPIERIDWMTSARIRLRKSRKRGQQARLILRQVERVAVGVSGLASYGKAVLYARFRDRREQALKLFDTSIQEARDADVLAAAQYRSGDLLGKLGRDKEAIARLEPLLKMQLGQDFRAKIQWRLFRLQRAQKQWLEAERLLNALVDTANPRRKDALWELAWRRFTLGDTLEALRSWERLRDLVGPEEDDGKQPWRARIDYWRARCYALLDRKDDAKATFAAVARRHPQTYYGMVSRDRLSVLDPSLAASVAPVTLHPSDGEEAALDLTKLHVQRDPLLDGPVLLLRMGLLTQARDLLRGVVPKRLPRDGVHLLAALYHQTGRPRAAFALLRRHARRAAAPDDASASVWRVAYATPYGEEFAEAADQAGIPRSLLYAVARHESHFVRTARSAAGAVGLVQLLPMVARRISGLYGLKKRSARALTRPSYNLAIGARYIAQLHSFLRGNHAMVLAAYNAGPYAVRRWWKRSGRVPTDVFVESIPYAQARHYARGVLATAAAYAHLHPQWAEGGRLRLGRQRDVPQTFGPFMVPPAAGDETAGTTGLPCTVLAAPRDPR